MRTVKEKLSSRKLWMALAGVLSGVGLIVGGSTQEGAMTIVASVLGYLAAEGLVDAKQKSDTEKIAQAVVNLLPDSTTTTDKDITNNAQ